MKKYIAPEMAVSLFDSENVATTASEPGKGNAIDAAKTTLGKINDVEHTFTVDLLF